MAYFCILTLFLYNLINIHEYANEIIKFIFYLINNKYIDNISDLFLRCYNQNNQWFWILNTTMLNIKNIGGYHGNTPAISLSSATLSSNNRNVLTYTLSFKKI